MFFHYMKHVFYLKLGEIFVWFGWLWVLEKNGRLESLHSELIGRRVCVNDIKILGLWATTLWFELLDGLKYSMVVLLYCFTALWNELLYGLNCSMV